MLITIIYIDKFVPGKYIMTSRSKSSVNPKPHIHTQHESVFRGFASRGINTSMRWAETGPDIRKTWCAQWKLHQPLAVHNRETHAKLSICDSYGAKMWRIGTNWDSLRQLIWIGES